MVLQNYYSVCIFFLFIHRYMKLYIGKFRNFDSILKLSGATLLKYFKMVSRPVILLENRFQLIIKSKENVIIILDPANVILTRKVDTYFRYKWNHFENILKYFSGVAYNNFSILSNLKIFLYR